MTDKDRHDDAREDERELDALLQQLGIEKAPAGLTQRLLRIPDEEAGRPAWWRRWVPAAPGPRWVLAPAMAAVVAIVAVVMLQSRQPSEAEILQARHDLAVAFSYIDRAGLQTGREIQAVLGGELQHSVKDNLSHYMLLNESPRKEEST